MNTARTIRRGITVMATAVLCVVVVLPAYAAYEDSLKGYWKMDDTSMDDNFSSGTINSNRWTAYGNISISGGKADLYYSGSTGWGASDLVANSRLKGDFDVQVDLNVIALTTPSVDFDSLRMTVDDGNSFNYIGKVKYSNGVERYYMRTQNFATSITDSKLRYVRSGTTLTGYYWNGSSWGSLGSVAFTANDTQIYLTAINTSSGSNTIEGKYDNFTVTNGEPVADAKGINAGTIYGATQTTGKFGTALNFDGVDDYVQIAASPNGYNDTTMSVWFKPANLPTLGDWRKIVSNYGSGKGLQIDYDGNTLVFDGRPYGGDFFSAVYDTQLQIGTWYNITGVKEDNYLKLYVNGVKCAEADLGSDQAIQALSNTYLGKYVTGAYYANGTIDDPAIWNRALDANEIGMVYDLGTEKFEWLTLGVNDAEALNLGYATSELKLLADLYAAGNTSSSEVIDGLTWHYLSGDLPGDIGGTTYDYGDTWTYDGKSYIKLGSGLEGSPIPEPGCAFGLLVGFFVPGFRRLLKRGRKAVEISSIKMHDLVIFMVILLMALMTATPSALAVDYEEATSYWKLDGNAMDSNGSNNGTVYGAISSAGKFGNALSFDGIDDKATFGTSVANFGSNDFTISLWAKKQGDGTGGGDLISIRRAGTPEGFTFYGSKSSTSAGLYLYMSSTSSGSWNMAGPEYFGWGFEYDVWHNPVLTRNGSTFSLYLDGQYVTGFNSSGMIDNTGYPLTLSSSATGSENLKGSIDDVGIWDRALDSYEIGAIYVVGIEAFEYLSFGVDNLTLGMDTEEIATLAQLYSDGKAGLTPDDITIGDNNWKYLSGNLPGDLGGTTYNVGDSWTYDGKSYIKLGSGLEGSPIPEPGCAFGLLVGFFVPGLRKVLKRKVRS